MVTRTGGSAAKKAAKKKWTKADFEKAKTARSKRQKILSKVISDLDKLRGELSVILTKLRVTTKGSLDPAPLPPADGPSIKKVPVVK